MPAVVPAYLPEEVKSASRLELSPRDFVQTVNVVTSEEMRDRGIVTMNEAVETITGVRPVSGVYSTQDVTTGIRARGFENRFSYINGLRFQAFGIPVETQMVDTLEVLKGPGGVVFGQGDPGGSLNITTKRPVADPFTELGYRYGSNDDYRMTLDTTGPLFSNAATDGDPALLYRFNAAYDSGNSYRDFVDYERVLVAPAFTVNLSPDTTLDFSYSYLKEDFLFDRGLPAYPIALDVHRGLFTGDPGMPRSWTENHLAFWNLEHRFNDDWKVVQRFGLVRQSGESFELSSYSPANGMGSDGLFPRDAYLGVADNTYWQIQHEVHGAFELAGLPNKMVLGVEYAHTKFGYSFSYINPEPFNLYNPIYGRYNFNAPASAIYPFESYGDSLWALYWDHQIELDPTFKVVAGLRADWSDGYYDSIYDTATTDRDKIGLSPRIGAVWQPTESVDLFTSYSQTFVPNVFADGTGTVFDPEEGEAFEAGFRKRVLNDRLQFSGAIFHITKQNVLNPDPTDPTGLRQILNGEERSQGFELEAKGELAPGWTLATGYAYLDAIITESTSYPVGLPLIDAPEHSLNFFTRYQVQSGWAKGAFAGYGLIYAGDRRSSYDNPTFELPSYVRHDAVVGYEKDAWQFQLTLENLFDEDYYETHGNNIFPQDGFNASASVTYTF